MTHRGKSIMGAALALLGLAPVYAQVPDHPIITEVFNNPSGSDGPVGRDPTNLHQEYIEIYLPTAAQLSAALNKDALRMAFYEIEGDSSNSQRGHVNLRLDLPTFDLDTSNGVTPGAVARPSSGVIVIGWVDYDPNAPTDPNNPNSVALAGTPATRLGLIDGGITTSPAGTLFIAANGAQSGGTSNFAVPVAESRIDVPNEQVDGMLTNGSNVYLLVNRDDAGYGQFEDRLHPELGPSDPNLPGGVRLGLSALLDGIAGNDDVLFSITKQPYQFPTGNNIDLEDVLPDGGAFSLWVAQIAEGSGGGYARRFVDQLRTTEDAIPGNEDPAADAAADYRDVFRSGPFLPTPGSVVFTTSPPELGVSAATRLTFSVLADTTGRPGLLSANVGGDFGIDISATPGVSSDPNVASFATAAAALAVPGQAEGFPQIAVTVPAGATNGAMATAALTFTATNTNAGDPAVVNPTGSSTATVTVLNPTMGIDDLGLPSGATVFAAVQGFGADPNVANEFATSDLAAFVSANLGGLAGQSLGNAAILLDPATDLEDILTVDPLRLSFPTPDPNDPNFINAPGAPGTPNLVATVVNSSKVVSGSAAYDASVNPLQTGVKAIEIAIPETKTSGGTFSPSEMLFFANSIGDVFNQRSGLSRVTTDRTFELALIDTNVTTAGIESGDVDDFGLIVEVGQVGPGASVVPGQFVFLGYMGGLDGEDIDSVDVPGVNATVAILLDLDNLDTVLGAQTITRLFVIDADTGGTLNVMEAFSLAGLGVICPGNTDGDGAVNITDLGNVLSNFGLTGAGITGDVDGDGDVDITDLGTVLTNFGTTCS